jgi:hypothetical protein
MYIYVLLHRYIGLFLFLYLLFSLTYRLLIKTHTNTFGEHSRFSLTKIDTLLLFFRHLTLKYLPDNSSKPHISILSPFIQTKLLKLEVFTFCSLKIHLSEKDFKTKSVFKKKVIAILRQKSVFPQKHYSKRALIIYIMSRLVCISENYDTYLKYTCYTYL